MVVKNLKNLISAIPPDDEFDIISANVTAPLTSRLAFVMADVSILKTYKIPINLLLDSGCAHSILSYEIFKQFPDSHKSKLKPVPPTFKVESFDGSQSPIVGIVDVRLHFTGSNGIYSAYQLPVIVHKSTTHDFMLGRDFTGVDKKIKVLETPTHMYLRLDKSNTRLVGLHQDLQSLMATTCAVPIFETGPGSIPIMTNKQYVIPPGRTANVSCRLIDPNIEPEEEEIPFEVCSVSLENATSPDALYFLKDYNKFSISITNHSELDDLYVLPNLPIAQIAFLPNDVSVHNISVTTDSKKISLW